MAAIGRGAVIPPLAHAGHWFAGLLYAAPVVVLAAALWVQSLRDKRRDRKKKESDGERRNP
jgi:cyanate permease